MLYVVVGLVVQKLLIVELAIVMVINIFFGELLAADASRSQQQNQYI